MNETMNLNTPTEYIDINKIKRRLVNVYHEIDNIELDESILKYGLIHPISVYHYEGQDEYTISSGQRRYDAVCRLHTRYPDNPNFQKIECRVYVITEDPNLLFKGFPYITKEQEEGIYRDSNNLARQLTDEDIASQILYITDKFKDPEYVQQLKANAAEAGFKTYNKKDNLNLISSVLKTEGMWSREKIRQFFVIQKYAEESGDTKLLNLVVNGQIKVSAAYKQVVEEQGTSRNKKTDYIKPIEKAVTELMEASKDAIFTQEDINRVSKVIEDLQVFIYDARKK